MLAAADGDSVLVWRLDDEGTPPERHRVHSATVTSASWSPDSKTLATLGADGGIVLLDLSGRRRVGALVTDALDGTQTTLWPIPGAAVIGTADGRLLFVDTTDGTVRPAWDRLHHTNIITARAAGGGLLVTSDWEGLTAVWDPATRRMTGTLPVPRSGKPPYWGATWASPDGTQAATIREPAGPVILDLRTRRVVRRLPPLPPSDPPDDVEVLGWSPDGTRLIVTRQFASSSDLLLVDARTGRTVLKVDTGAAYAWEAEMDPAGRWIAAITEAGALLVLDAATGNKLAPQTLQAAEGSALNVSMRPDGRYIATSGDPPRVVLWDSRTLREVGIPLPMDVDAPDARARFAPDGRLLVLSGRTLRAFEIDPDVWLERACRVAGRILTEQELEEVLPDRPHRPACT
jgi:WD40 repeat protein